MYFFITSLCCEASLPATVKSPLNQVGASMSKPKRHRRKPCCSKCGRPTRGHIGPHGKNCAMPDQRFEGAEELDVHRTSSEAPSTHSPRGRGRGRARIDWTPERPPAFNSFNAGHGGNKSYDDAQRFEIGRGRAVMDFWSQPRPGRHVLSSPRAKDTFWEASGRSLEPPRSGTSNNAPIGQDSFQRGYPDDYGVYSESSRQPVSFSQEAAGRQDRPSCRRDDEVVTEPSRPVSTAEERANRYDRHVRYHHDSLVDESSCRGRIVDNGHSSQQIRSQDYNCDCVHKSSDYIAPQSWQGRRMCDSSHRDYVSGNDRSTYCAPNYRHPPTHPPACHVGDSGQFRQNERTHGHNITPGAEHVSQRVASAALNGEFIDLCDLLNAGVDVDEFKSSIDSNGNLSFKSVKQSKSIVNVYKWLEAWGVYELIMVKAFGYELFVQMNRYRNFIIGLFQKFKAPQVITYDFKHRQRLSTCYSSNFVTLDHDLYVTIFDAQALRNVNKCNKCSSVDHSSVECPFKSSQQSSDPFRSKRGQSSSNQSSNVKGQVCQRFQNDSCRFGNKCRYKHECFECGGSEGFKSCSRCRKLLQGKDGTSQSTK